MTSIEENCSGETRFCQSKRFLYYPIIETSAYSFEISASLTQNQKEMFAGIQFWVVTSDENYVLSFLILRYFLFVFSFGSSVVYFIFFFKSKEITRTFEHKYLVVFSISIALLNNPLAAWSVFRPSVTLNAISCFFSSQFIGVCLFFWMVVWKRAKLESGEIKNAFLSIIIFGIPAIVFINSSLLGLIYFFENVFSTSELRASQ